MFQRNDGVINPNIQPKNNLTALLNKTDFHVFVAFEGTELVGGLTAFQLNMYKLIPSKMLLYEMGVELNHRRHGIGRKLIKEFIDFSKKSGVNKILVLTTTENFETIKFYKATNGNLESNHICFSYSI